MPNSNNEIILHCSHLILRYNNHGKANKSATIIQVILIIFDGLKKTFSSALLHSSLKIDEERISFVIMAFGEFRTW